MCICVYVYMCIILTNSNHAHIPSGSGTGHGLAPIIRVTLDPFGRISTPMASILKASTKPLPSGVGFASLSLSKKLHWVGILRSNGKINLARKVN